MHFFQPVGIFILLQELFLQLIRHQYIPLGRPHSIKDTYAVAQIIVYAIEFHPVAIRIYRALRLQFIQAYSQMLVRLHRQYIGLVNSVQ